MFDGKYRPFACPVQITPLKGFCSRTDNLPSLELYWRTSCPIETSNQLNQPSSF